MLISLMVKFWLLTVRKEIPETESSGKVQPSAPENPPPHTPSEVLMGILTQRLHPFDSKRGFCSKPYLMV
jgi:hypothetical protein